MPDKIVMPMPGRIDGFASCLKSRLEAGEFAAIIDRRYNLVQIAEAHRYVELGLSDKKPASS